MLKSYVIYMAFMQFAAFALGWLLPSNLDLLVFIGLPIAGYRVWKWAVMQAAKAKTGTGRIVPVSSLVTSYVSFVAIERVFFLCSAYLSVTSLGSRFVWIILGYFAWRWMLSRMVFLGLLELPELQKQRAAVAKIMVNLFEATTSTDKRDHGPLVLDFQRPDSRFRHINFCLSTAFFFCADSIKNGEAVLVQCQRELVDFAVSYRGQDPLLNGPVDHQKVATESETYLQDFVKRWSAWIASRKTRADAGMKGSSDETTSMVCAMLRDVESAVPLTEEDKQRLWPLASWIENSVASIDGAFTEMVNGRAKLA